ncbi:MAG: hypothetical protein JW982_02600 [Spirochaetes bacterium]|nr:hypothetical protein [Spirochaetota bacterium]
MKKLICLFLILSGTVSAADNNAVNEANKLINERKYLSAFELLDKEDPKNENPDILILKTDIVLKYFVKSNMHVMFALRDLKQNDDLIEIRKGVGSYSMFIFDPEEELSSLIKKYPENFQLYKSLGYFYNEVLYKYGSNWKVPPENLMNLYEKNYKKAYDNGVYDYWSLYGLGYAKMIKKDYNEAITYFEKAILLKDDDPVCLYNLGYAYMLTKQPEKGIKYADKAYNLYDYKPYKADAARIAGLMNMGLNDYSEAEKYLIKSDEANPENYNTYTLLIYTDLKLNNTDYIKWTKKVFDLSAEDQNYYSDVVEMYLNFDKLDEILKILNGMKKFSGNSDKSSGNIYYFTGWIYLKTGNKVNAKNDFIRSASYFRKVYPEDHGVFELIDSAIRDIDSE